ncbi:tumor necrosis factor receptor superfamily member 6B-like [Cebidichthys violaceus]|uniref:tumor necrosis factor receptor superfamily member 6B-like n=1 Tax=Cebidichthys violaceus TaxID=271503 RepID=UPI0035CBBB70
MHIISMFLLPVLLLLSGVDSTPTFEHRDSFTGEALICDKCSPGTHMTKYCTANTPTACAPCKSNHFTELWNYLPKCLYCSNLCTENQEVETECTATTNRVCRCKDGFFDFFDSCMRHKECGPGHGVQTKGTSQTNTVCERCPDGYFSTSSSALESCVKHQECANGQIALLPDSINQDKMCGTCEDLTNSSDTLRTFFSGFFSMHRMRVIKMKRFVARYIHKSEEGTLPKQRGPLMDQIRAWLAQAPEEQLKALPKMLQASQLCSLTDKLETIFKEIKQQSPNCTLPLLDV